MFTFVIIGAIMFVLMSMAGMKLGSDWIVTIIPIGAPDRFVVIIPISGAIIGIIGIVCCAISTMVKVLGVRLVAELEGLKRV